MFAIHIPPAGEAQNVEVLRQFRIVNDHVGSVGSSTSAQTVSNALTIVSSSSATTQTLPPAEAFPGRWFKIKNRGTGVVTVSPQGSDTIDGKTAVHLWKNACVTVESDGSDWVVTGFLSAAYT